MRYVKFLVVIVLFVLTMALFAQNMDALGAPLALSLHLFGTDIFAFDYPVYMFLLGTFFVGALITFMYFLCEKVRIGRELSVAQKKIATLEQEVNSLRNLPLEDAMSASGESSATQE